MNFGWINLFGAGIVILILIPNIIYAVKKRDKSQEKIIPKYLVILEQIGRYGCMAFMIVPLFVWEFGFGSVFEFLLYIIFNGILIGSYYIFWIAYSKKKTIIKAMALAIIPTAIFLLSGILLHHWCLVAFSLIFGYSHCRITYINSK